NITHFTAQYHPYCTPIWPILQRSFYVIENQLLRNPFSKVLPQSHSPSLWEGRGRYLEELNRAFGEVTKALFPPFHRYFSLYSS
ncbi:hypothetical protein, partial [Segatella maculosa]|uniref:hypothetical protein n=1 Tax=Segatella maculosa TaxID=439703 RepID=UPI0023F4F3BF